MSNGAMRTSKVPVLFVGFFCFLVFVFLITLYFSYVSNYDCIGSILNAWNGIGLANVHSIVFIG